MTDYVNLDRVSGWPFSMTAEDEPTPVELARSKDAKDRSRRFRQTVQNGGDFEIVGHGELDDEFDFIDGEVPSAVNGSSHSDADAIMDGLDSAFRAGWDDDE